MGGSGEEEAEKGQEGQEHSGQWVCGEVSKALGHFLIGVVHSRLEPLLEAEATGTGLRTGLKGAIPHPGTQVGRRGED